MAPEIFVCDGTIRICTVIRLWMSYQPQQSKILLILWCIVPEFTSCLMRATS